MKKAAALPEQHTLRDCFKVESRLLTSANCSHKSVQTHTHTNAHTRTCITVVASFIHTIHPPQWPGKASPAQSTYLLHSNLAFGFDSSSFMPLWLLRGTTPSMLSICHSCPSENGKNGRLDTDAGSQLWNESKVKLYLFYDFWVRMFSKPTWT